MLWHLRGASLSMIGNQALDRTRERGSLLPAAPGGVAKEAVLPDRYRITREASGAVITCVEAPTVAVHVQHGVTVTAAAARSAAPGSIFVDGAAQGEPFLDPQREVYNLDHHEGCVRAFTLAACEQAMVLVRKGLDLRKRDWTVYANNVDLDSVLAIWVLLNHISLNERGGETRGRVMPLVRLQGVIDAQGLELQDLTAFPPELLAEMQAWIAGLRERELALKKRGRWHEPDLAEQTLDLLRAVDRLIYSPEQFVDLEEIEQLARVEIANGSVAIVCRSRVGIYEVERQLRRLHGKRLGVIALRTGPSSYSLRQVDPYLPATLEQIYAHLNLVDPAAGGKRSTNRWGGSAEIGGSPRTSGTQVTPQQIAEACQQAFSTPTLLQRLRRVAVTALGSTGVVLAALASVLWPEWLGDPSVPSGPAANPAQFAILLAALGAAFFLPRALRAPGLYGLRRPAALDWWGLLPVALLGALAGGVWVPAATLSLPDWLALLSAFVLPLAAEVIFRGLFHGSLVTSFAVQECGGRWFLSWPTVLSATLFALSGAVLQHPAVSLTRMPVGNFQPYVPLLGAFLFGMAAGVARERSESIAASILFHWVCVAAVLLLAR